MRTEGTEMRKGRIVPIHVALATAILGLLVMPIAFAGATPTASASASSLRKQVKSLKKRVAALESRSTPTTTAPPIPTTLPPNGRAGGSLIGTYPNPLIGPDTIGPAEIVDSGVGRNEIADNSVTTNEIANGSVFKTDLNDLSVGARQLTGTYERVSGPTDLDANEVGGAAATCNPGDKVLGGGYAWLRDHDPQTGALADVSVISSTPNVPGGATFNNPSEWAVGASSSINNTLFAWAVCISA